MKYQIRFLLGAFIFSLLTMSGAAQAAIYSINYTGSFVAILDAAGNPGGSFSPGAGVNIGDTYSGNFSFDTDQAMPTVSPPGPPPGGADYDFGSGTVQPIFTVNGTRTVDLTPKIGLTVVDNADTTIGPFVTEAYIQGGMRLAGINPFPTSADLLILYTDVMDFDANPATLSEIVLVTLDPNGAALSGTNIPNPLTPLSNSFFIYLESENGVAKAAGIGLPAVTPVPIPAAVWLFGSGLLGLIGFARRKKTMRQ